MKCFNHPDKDAVGLCQYCGKAVCNSCAQTFLGKVFCLGCSQALKRRVEAASISKPFTLPLALLTWTNLAFSILIGAYIIYILVWGLLIPLDFNLLLTYITSIAALTIIPATILLFSGYEMLRGRLFKGGLMNVASSIILFQLFWYFNWYTPLIADLWPINLLSFTPALASGILGICLELLKKAFSAS